MTASWWVVMPFVYKERIGAWEGKTSSVLDQINVRSSGYAGGPHYKHLEAFDLGLETALAFTDK